MIERMRALIVFILIVAFGLICISMQLWLDSIRPHPPLTELFAGVSKQLS